MRFEVGEMARFVVARNESGIPFIGQVVEVVELNPRAGDFSFGRMSTEDADYVARFDDSDLSTIMDYQLQKLNPSEEPIEMTQTEECEA